MLEKVPLECSPNEFISSILALHRYCSGFFCEISALQYYQVTVLFYIFYTLGTNVAQDSKLWLLTLHSECECNPMFVSVTTEPMN